MKSFNFSIQSKSSRSLARCGVITTPHGAIKTPAFVTVGTKGTIKALAPVDLALTHTQFVFSNTYHLVISPGPEIIKKAGGIHAFSGIDTPIITDSGGFQVFSLAKNKDPQSPTLVKITDDGVEFRTHYDGKTFFFSPEFSVSAQIAIGADFVVSLDENIYYGATKKYTIRSLGRTQDWAKRSLDTLKKSQKQKMYGVIQGGMFEDLHKKSVTKIASLSFWGLAIGGVSVGMTKKEIRQNVGWTMDCIKSDIRPRHLLGIGHLDDIIAMVKMGIDTFDCVVPTRDARMGKLYVNSINSQKSMQFLSSPHTILDITKIQYKADVSPVDALCECYTCTHFTRAYLHHLCKQHELLFYRLATIHNLYFMEDFFSKLRTLIEENRL